MAPSELPQRLQDQFMAELHEEVSKCLVRAGLQSATVTAPSLSRERRCLWAHSSSHARSPSVEGSRKEIAKRPRGDFLSRSSQPQSRGHRSRVQQQSLSPECQQASKAPPGLPQDPTGIPHHLLAHHAHTALMSDCTTLSELHLQSQQWESRKRGISTRWPDSTLMHSTECPHSPPGSVTECSTQGPTKKQVCFDLTKDLGDTLPLPNDLAHFLGDTTDEQINAACQSALWP